ncbi:hypothetical protein FPV67DRAFT_1648890 [Lyophyllum atratum]|nr:hypothetical protein FPV67DRAFT_1648890 [Lyophyllum atratum]
MRFLSSILVLITLVAGTSAAALPEANTAGFQCMRQGFTCDLSDPHFQCCTGLTCNRSIELGEPFNDVMTAINQIYFSPSDFSPTEISNHYHSAATGDKKVHELKPVSIRIISPLSAIFFNDQARHAGRLLEVPVSTSPDLAEFRGKRFRDETRVAIRIIKQIVLQRSNKGLLTQANRIWHGSSCPGVQKRFEATRRGGRLWELVGAVDQKGRTPGESSTSPVKIKQESATLITFPLLSPPPSRCQDQRTCSRLPHHWQRRAAKLFPPRTGWSPLCGPGFDGEAAEVGKGGQNVIRLRIVGDDRGGITSVHPRRFSNQDCARGDFVSETNIILIEPERKGNQSDKWQSSENEWNDKLQNRSVPLDMAE